MDFKDFIELGRTLEEIETNADGVWERLPSHDVVVECVEVAELAPSSVANHRPPTDEVLDETIMFLDFLEEELGAEKFAELKAKHAKAVKDRWSDYALHTFDVVFDAVGERRAQKV